MTVTRLLRSLNTTRLMKPVSTSIKLLSLVVDSILKKLIILQTSFFAIEMINFLKTFC